jgi:hypothetical protein
VWIKPSAIVYSCGAQTRALQRGVWRYASGNLVPFQPGNRSVGSDVDGSYTSPPKRLHSTIEVIVIPMK